MVTVNKTIPVMMVLIIIGYPLAMSGLGLGWVYLGFGMIVASIVIFLAVEILNTAIYWRRSEDKKDKKLSDASQMLIFNAITALLLFGYVTWKGIAILSDSNMILLIWMSLNIMALSRLWVPKESDEALNPKSETIIEAKNKEA